MPEKEGGLTFSIFQRSEREVVNLLASRRRLLGSNRLEVFGSGEFFLPVVKRPKALRLQLERRSRPRSPPVSFHLLAEERINPAEVSRALRFEPVENIPIDPK
ncbi:MAG: hypothetical protein A3H28_00715 [Acidobacteria bacterium RIFCSPLOWO2_02_FULL_61_28]|nr:MAG: hypothetical protein A3H28_00715 [Acidobacteria bacterium RIFCSPLOWO2_02_FULL_61_28]